MKCIVEVYIVSVEVKPLAGSEMLAEGGIGGFVYCCVLAKSAKSALKKVHDALEQDHYEIVKVELVDKYDGYKWDEAEDQKAYDILAEEARLNGDVVYGPFFTYMSLEDDEEE